jgi:hypothetical protein
VQATGQIICLVHIASRCDMMAACSSCAFSDAVAFPWEERWHWQQQQ